MDMQAQERAVVVTQTAKSVAVIGKQLNENCGSENGVRSVYQ